MQNQPLPRIRTPFKQRLEDFRRGPLTALIWFLAVGLSFVLMQDRGSRMDLIGIAEALDYEISPVTNGILESLHVDLFEPVERGTIIGRLESQNLEARIATASAEISRLTSVLKASEQRMRNEALQANLEWDADLRRYVIDETEFQLEALQIQVVLETDRIESQRLELVLERTKALVEEQVLSQVDLDNATLAHATILKRIERNEAVLTELEQNLTDAQIRRQRFAERPTPDSALQLELDALQQSVRVQTLRLEELAQERRHLLLKAPATGQINQVLARPGQAILAGEPVAMLRPQVADAIVMYIPEHASFELEPQQRVWVSKSSAPQLARAESAITTLGPSIEELPVRLRRDPTIPEYCRKVLIAAVPSLNLVPGERVQISFKN